MESTKNLMEAFAGESQANRKYLAYARKAQEDGYENIARLFRIIAEAETIHALKHFEIAGKVGSTLDNLKDAVDGETYEFSQMYPAFIEKAREEKADKAARTFNMANEAEKVHGALYEQALAAVESGEDIKVGSLYLCPVCGNVTKDEAPERCSICGVPGGRFQKF